MQHWQNVWFSALQYVPNDHQNTSVWLQDQRIEPGWYHILCSWSVNHIRGNHHLRLWPYDSRLHASRIYSQFVLRQSIVSDGETIERINEGKCFDILTPARCPSPTDNPIARGPNPPTSRLLSVTASTHMTSWRVSRNSTPKPWLGVIPFSCNRGENASVCALPLWTYTTKG